MTFTRKSHLPRLERGWYHGRAAVLWTHTLEDRATGWLTGDFHARFREVLLHACARYALATPAYVLMPDHWHVMWLGLDADSDQRLATAFLRKHVPPHLGASRLQDRAHDHVLRAEERRRDALQSACTYVCENPLRAGLLESWREWPHLGAVIAGYPDLDPRDDDFWGTFWKIHNRLVDRNSVPALTRRATPASRGPLREERDRTPKNAPQPAANPCAHAQGHETPPSRA